MSNDEKATTKELIRSLREQVLELQRQNFHLAENNKHQLEKLIALETEFRLAREGKKEGAIKDRFIAGLLVGAIFSIVQIAMKIWEVVSHG